MNDLDFAALGEQVVLALQSYGAAERHGEWWARCPFHEESTPSFAYHPEKMCWKCQGCGLGGGVVDLARRLGIRAGAISPDVMAEMADRRVQNKARMEELRREKSEALARWWALHAEETRLHGENRMLLELMASGIRASAIDHFNLGVTEYPVYDNDLGGWRRVDALTIPWTVRGQIRGLQYRLSEDIGGRYRWHEGSRARLFNADAVLDRHDDTLVVVEGAKKAAALWSHGITSVCGIVNKGAWAGLLAESERFTEPFRPFRRVVFALDPDARAESSAAAASIPNGWQALLPDKPDDFLFAIRGDVDLFAAYLDRAKRP